MAIQVTTTPQGAGNPQIFTTWFSVTSHYNYITSYIDYYYLVANPSFGYRFAGIKCVQSKTTSGGSSTQEWSVTVRTGNTYPKGSPTDQSHADLLFAHYRVYDSWSGTPVLTEEDDIISVEVLYERVYTPTHLLINSSTRESPVKLVYDPATNLLVADY